MNEKDKQILKDSVDVIVSSIPALSIAWGLSKALYGAGLKLRQQKALEWVEMVRDNPGIFTHELLIKEEFQDGFVFALEKYITERSEKKRIIFRAIFLGFTEADNQVQFPLEKFLHTLNMLNEKDILVLRDVDVTKDKESDRNYQVYPNSSRNIDNIFNLVAVGILLLDLSSRIGSTGIPFVRITLFGKEFVKYLT